MDLTFNTKKGEKLTISYCEISEVFTATKFDGNNWSEILFLNKEDFIKLAVSLSFIKKQMT